MSSGKVRTAFLAMLLIGTTSMSGCATMTKKTGVERAERTTTSMETVDSDLKQASRQIDTTNASLDDVIRTGVSSSSQPADVKKSFETYSGNVAKMEDIGKTLNKHIDRMNSQGNAYFEEWGKTGGTYSDPELQRLSAEQHVRASKSFSAITTAGAGMRGQLNAYLAEIKQIQTYLSNDLTLSGISAIASRARVAEQAGDNLKGSFMPVQSAIAQARNDLTPGGAAAGGSEGRSSGAM